MPELLDFRDLPHVWGKGFYRMDVAALQARLTSAKLFLGDVAETVLKFLGSDAKFPLGFVAFDLDYYSSTAQALTIFDGAAQHGSHAYFAISTTLSGQRPLVTMNT